ncbi:hypothetical protein B0G75_104273 [Paraburkholderia sp. BL18I3N2]|uniref:hypothetical protein n=1 Tax=Paraburkholderia sp. BL18I3N2 TaxID=1938799 RepID=UPI000D4CE1FC|nr:hypothetical protein [Paraburkholderia sp. BL18I3N2]PRX32252.1 hypothetical protein B0G75_104273 [Paraburkholderia sp. BL18I3N2]
MNYALVENGVVVNVIVWDGHSDWQPPNGQTVVQIPDGVYAGIGSTYSNGTFGEPPQPSSTV